MSEMVERVAMAMAEQSKARVAGIHFVTKMPMDGEEDFWALARAAIEAMRSPTDKMYEAANFGSYPGDPNSFGDMWSQAIDAALQEDGQ